MLARPALALAVWLCVTRVRVFSELSVASAAVHLEYQQEVVVTAYGISVRTVVVVVGLGSACRAAGSQAGLVAVRWHAERYREPQEARAQRGLPSAPGGLRPFRCVRAGLWDAPRVWWPRGRCV